MCIFIMVNVATVSGILITVAPASTAVCTHFTKNGNSVRVASSGEN